MLDSFWKTVVLYLILVVTVRLMGKRQIGQLEPAEFVVAMALADLATLPMQGQPLHTGIVPMITILIIEKCSALLSMRSVTFRKLLCGKPVILMENGKMLQDNMRKTKVTIDELTCHLREKDVLDPRQVQYAILETDGNLSVFLFPEQAPPAAADLGVAVPARKLPVTIVSDGAILKDNLKKAGRDRRWLEKALKSHGARLEETWLLTVDEDGNEIFYSKSGN